MATSPLTAQSDLVTFSIRSNGKEINDSFQIYSIKINKQINKNDTAEITLLAGGIDEFQGISGSDTFEPDAQIDIKLGYDNNNIEVFTGSVTKQIVRVNQVTGSALDIICTRENNHAKDIIEYNTTSAPSLEVEYGVDIMDTELALNSKYKSSVLTKYSGYIVFQGSALAKENSLISVKGFGPLFDGNVFISGVEHKISNGNWLTEVRIGISPDMVTGF